MSSRANESRASIVRRNVLQANVNGDRPDDCVLTLMVEAYPSLMSDLRVVTCKLFGSRVEVAVRSVVSIHQVKGPTTTSKGGIHECSVKSVYFLHSRPVFEVSPQLFRTTTTAARECIWRQCHLQGKRSQAIGHHPCEADL